MKVWLLRRNTSSNPYAPNFQVQGVYEENADIPDHSGDDDADKWDLDGLYVVHEGAEHG